MNRIMMIVGLLCCLCITGCDPNGIDYTTTCDLKKVDGKAVNVTVTLPPSQNQPPNLVLSDRQQVQQMIDALESLKLDLELARDQMPTQEPEQPEQE